MDVNVKKNELNVLSEFLGRPLLKFKHRSRKRLKSLWMIYKVDYWDTR